MLFRSDEPVVRALDELGGLDRLRAEQALGDRAKRERSCSVRVVLLAGGGLETFWLCDVVALGLRREVAFNQEVHVYSFAFFLLSTYYPPSSHRSERIPGLVPSA